MSIENKIIPIGGFFVVEKSRPGGKNPQIFRIRHHKPKIGNQKVIEKPHLRK